MMDVVIRRIKEIERVGPEAAQRIRREIRQSARAGAREEEELAARSVAVVLFGSSEQRKPRTAD